VSGKLPILNKYVVKIVCDANICTVANYPGFYITIAPSAISIIQITCGKTVKYPISSTFDRSVGIPYVDTNSVSGAIAISSNEISTPLSE